MNPSRIFILRPVATSLLMVAILLAGIVAFRILPLSALPEVDYPTIQIVTLYPGASPDVVTSSITAPLERQFGQMPGLNQMSSTSSGGASVITLQFSLDLSLDIAEQQVQAAINASGSFLPADLPTPPLYNKVNPADTPIVILALTSKTLPLTKLYDLGDTRLATKLSQVPGVGLVSLSGGQRPAVRIQANPKALASLGLSMDDLRTAITNANTNQAKGSFDGPTRASTIDANDQLKSADEYKSLIIAFRNNAPVRLTDVADIIDGAENTRLAAWANLTPGIIINIQRQPGANVIDVVDRVKAMLPQLKDSMPAAVDVTMLTDRTVTIRASVHDVEFELLLSIALVVLVIFLFLRSLAGTIIPSVAVPLSLVGTFGVMYLAGFSINNLTLMALTIATGFVVDDAIVMIENIARYIEKGMAPLEAALKGSEQIGFTIISLTFSLIAVLIPLLFMGDVVGRLFREFAITLAVAILISAVVSLTLTPMMCAKLLRHTPEEKQSRFYRRSGELFDRVIARYGKMLNWVLDRQAMTLIGAVITLVLTVVLYILIPKGFFPIQDTGAIQGISEAAQNISFASMAERQQALAEVIVQDPAVASLSSFIGVDGTNSTLNSGRMLINLKPLEDRDARAVDIIRRLQTKLADVPGIALYMQPVQDLTIEDRVSRTQYQFTLEDPSFDELSEWTPQLVERLRRLPQFADVASDLQDGGLQAFVDNRSRIGEPDGHHSGRHRQCAVQRIRPAADLDDLHADQPVPRRPGGEARVQARSDSDRRDLCGKFDSGPAGPADSALVDRPRYRAPRAARDQPHRPVPGGDHFIQPGARRIAGRRGEDDRAGRARDRPAGQRAGSLPGRRAGVPVIAGQRAVADPRGNHHDVHRPRRAVRELHTSGDHPVDAAIGGRRRAARADPVQERPQHHRDHRDHLLIGIVKKNAIMMIDFAIDAERNEGLAPRDAIFQACLLRFRRS
jgi:multidrug efflux pump